MNTFVDLTTVDNVQEYLPIAQANRAASKDEVQRFLTGASSFLVQAVNRYPIVKRYAETRDGTGGSRMMLSNSPLRQVNTVKVGGVSISASPDGIVPGYVVGTSFITLIGYEFTRGLANVSLDYYAGWIPAVAPAWQANKRVDLFDFILDSNKNIQQVTTPGTTDGGAPTWASNVGDSTPDGTQVVWALVVPSPEMVLLERAAIELTAQKWRRRAHLDETTYSMGGEITTAFSTKDVPDEVQTVINQLRWVLPIQR